MRKKIIIILIIILALMILAGVLVFAINAYVKGSTRDRVLTAEEAGELEDVDCILVLGCKVYDDGRLSPILADRLEIAEKVYKTGVTEKLLMSGDHGREDYDEVRAMKNYMIDTGAAVSSDIFMDHAGFSTYESMYRAGDVFNAKKIIIVTNEYHIYRSLYIARSLGLEAYGVVAEDNYGGSSYREAREILARNKDFVKCIFKPEPTYLGEVIDIHGDGDATND